MSPMSVWSQRTKALLPQINKEFIGHGTLTNDLGPCFSLGPGVAGPHKYEGVNGPRGDPMSWGLTVALLK